MQTIHRSAFRKRALLALLFVAVASLGAILYVNRSPHEAAQPTNPPKPWFAPYVDVTNTPSYPFEQFGSTPHKDAILSFITAATSDPCTPTWGGTYSLDNADKELDLTSRISHLRAQGGDVAISFGGAIGDELASVCTDHHELVSAYKSVVDHYRIAAIDLDLESTGLTDTSTNTRRAKAIAELQTNIRRASGNLAIWVTLPVAPSGLTSDGTNTITTLLNQHVNLAGINIMTMEYGDSRPDSQSMLDASKSALARTHDQILTLYQNAGIPLSSQIAWSKLGVTPLIGRGTFPGEVFTLNDAKDFSAYARSMGVWRTSMWSANRDAPCANASIENELAADSCSGIEQHKFDFAKTLSNGFTGTLRENAAPKR